MAGAPAPRLVRGELTTQRLLRQLRVFDEERRESRGVAGVANFFDSVSDAARSELRAAIGANKLWGSDSTIRRNEQASFHVVLRVRPERLAAFRES